MARVTVIVLNYNGKPLLDECLTTVLAQDLAEPFDVLLWDNASRDGSVEHARSRFPDVEVVACPQNLGFARAMNEAVAKVASPYAVLLNNDVRVPTDWLRHLVQAADAAPDAAALGSRLCLYDRPELLNHAGAKIAPIGGGYDVGLFQPRGDFPAAEPHPTGIASGGAVLLRRDVFLGLGGFDDRFFMYFEDADFCLRAWLAGHRVLHVPRSLVYHKLGATTGSLTSPRRMEWGQRNRVLMLRKCWPGLRRVGASFWLAAYMVARSLVLAADGDGKTLAALWRGTWQGLRATDEGRRAAVAASRKVAWSRLRRQGLVATPWEFLGELRRLRRSVPASR